MSNAACEIVQALPDRPENNTISSSEAGQFRKLLTLQEVKTLVNGALNRETNVLDFSLESYSEGKLGFLGSHKRLRVDIQSKSGKETIFFFVKTVPYDVPTQAEYVIKKGVFEKEAIFYREIVPRLCATYDDEPWSPVCCMVKKDLIVFEDLRNKGYAMRNKLFDKELVAATLGTLARLHAASLIAEEYLGKPLNQIFPYAFKEKAFCPTGGTRQWINTGVNAAVAIAKHLGLESSLIPAVCEEVFPAVEASSTKRNVVSHGDLWGNNIMFNDDMPPKCLLVDFQLLRYCPLAHDVAQFLYLCTDRSFRELWEDTMLKHYYSMLRKALSSSKVSVEIPRWSEIVEGMAEQRLGALITAVLYFPTVLLDETLGAEIMDDPVSFSEYAFRDRNEIVLDNMKKDPVYDRRISEAVAELVELCSRLDEIPKPT